MRKRKGRQLDEDVLAEAQSAPSADDILDYQVRLRSGRVVRFVGRIVDRMPCEMFDRTRGEFFTGVKLVLEDARGRRLTTVGMREVTAQGAPAAPRSAACPA